MAKPPLKGGGKRPVPAVSAPEVVSPVWLIKAFLGMVVIALLCGYATLCGLFYRGQWQLVLHPARASAAPPTAGGVPFEVVRFGAGTTGVPRLTGWLIPAGPGARYADLTVLYLPGGDGSLLSDQATLADIHDAGLSIFAIDYRGYGQSAAEHPSERSMTEDTDAAWEYLTGSRGVMGERIVPYGEGIGASLAVRLAASRPGVAAVVLDRPDFTVEQRVRRDPRSGLLPVGLLLRDRFALLPALEQLKTPKLILSRGGSEDPGILKAADPKMTVLLPSASADGQYRTALQRFLDEYAPSKHGRDVVPTRTP